MTKVVMIDERLFDQEEYADLAVQEIRAMEVEVLSDFSCDHGSDWVHHVMSFEKVDAIMVDGDLDPAGTRQALEDCCEQALADVREATTSSDRRAENFDRLVQYVLVELVDVRDEGEAAYWVERSAQALNSDRINYRKLGLTDSDADKISAELEREVELRASL